MSDIRYTCSSCGEPAKKPSVTKTEDPKRSGSLGSWRCTGGCKGKVKVKREKV